MAKFRASARTVDMLGRQQIAGIPTAISELFKNAHDAYADRVEVDYYRKDGLFVLRDDGVGMTLEDFEERWLTLGTESKVQGRTVLGMPATDPRKPPRPILGEKGIGRLAIAAIGPQVLVLSRAERTREVTDVVAAYIHWGLFELPGITLDEVEVPIRSFPIGTVLSREGLASMLDEVDAYIARLGKRITGDERERFQKDLGAMRSVDPEQLEGYVPYLDLGDVRGTHFVIAPAYDLLDAILDDSNPDEASSIEKLLLGFSNSMTPSHPKSVITTAFRVWETDEASDDLVEPDKFFSPDEFRNADHYISGRFDEFGQFQGTVAVYGEEHEDYVVAWPGARGSPTKCGQFEIHLAAVQPQSIATTLPPDDHARLLAKTRRFGGLYIYRDGVRMLPYGDVDYDWLEIEKRRSKHAGYYYFSHRNLFGAILLSHEHNAALTEKAGREGFRENLAYRQLRDILKEFLVQVAGDFFREEGTYADRYHEKKGDLTRQARNLEKRRKQANRRRRDLKLDLENFFSANDAEEPQMKALELTESVEQELVSARQVKDPDRAARLLLKIESEARADLQQLEQSYRVVKPRGLGLGRQIRKDYEDYKVAYDQLCKEVFSGVRSLIEEEVTAEAKRARLNLDRRIRIERALKELGDTANRTARNERSETQTTLEKVRTEVREAARDRQIAVRDIIEETRAEFQSTVLQDYEDEKLVAFRNTLEQRILTVQQESTVFLQHVRSQLEAIDLSGELGQLDQIEALEERTLALEERAEYDLQLAQLGMAVDVINHEFDASVRSIRKSLRRLHAWADVNTDLDGLYQDLRTSFDHLDGYLTLFTPLHRRLHRQKTTFSGADIERYLRDLFARRFERHGIELKSTANFREWEVTEFPSSFYPVFVNLIDNAVFWLGRVTSERLIELNADGESVFVSNKGESIPERRWQVIFDQGVSFKPGGRGLGLYISREVLRRVDYDLEAVAPKPGMQVTFRIKPQEREA